MEFRSARNDRQRYLQPMRGKLVERNRLRLPARACLQSVASPLLPAHSRLRWKTGILGKHLLNVGCGGGVFFYDTINRTKISKLVFIKLAQEWKFTRFLPPNLHVWEMFIRPAELTAALDRHGLRHMDIRGTSPPKNPFKSILAMHKLNRGRISPAEFGKRVGGSIEGPDINVNYMGFAIKQ